MLCAPDARPGSANTYTDIHNASLALVPSASILGVVYAAKSTEDVRGSMPTQVGDCRSRRQDRAATLTTLRACASRKRRPVAGGAASSRWEASNAARVGRAEA
jgi:hypothetical protein